MKPDEADEARLRFVERFASSLAEAGIPRMPARVFIALFITESGRLTAAELAERLKVSPAAISGAVRYLTQVDLIGRDPEPGSRRDYYYINNDVWYELISRRDQVFGRWQASLAEGIKMVGPDTPEGARMTEALDFFEFLQKEFAALLEKWRQRKEELRDQRSLPT